MKNLSSSIYVHDFDPVIFRLPIQFSLGGLEIDHPAVRWYGVAYLAAFVFAYFLLTFLSKHERFVVPRDRVADFLTYAAMFGVFLGGRLGYFFLYWLPANGLAAWMDDPLIVIRVWEGGMASHGGMLGLMLFSAYYAKKQNLSWLGIGDGLCTVAPLGIMFGRLANFVNGELYGRVAPESAWRMKFPSELYELHASKQFAALDAATSAAPEVTEQLFSDGHYHIGGLIEAARSHPEVAQAISPFLSPRYPSQLYQAAAEGLIIFIILITLRWFCPNLRKGVLTGLFFALYAVARISVENFREPDAATIRLLGELTKGQFYSIFMLIAAAFFFYAAGRNWLQGPPPSPNPPSANPTE